MSTQFSLATLIPTQPVGTVETFTRYSDLTDMALRCGVLRAHLKDDQAAIERALERIEEGRAQDAAILLKGVMACQQELARRLEEADAIRAERRIAAEVNASVGWRQRLWAPPQEGHKPTTTCSSSLCQFEILCSTLRRAPSVAGALCPFADQVVAPPPEAPSFTLRKLRALPPQCLDDAFPPFITAKSPFSFADTGVSLPFEASIQLGPKSLHAEPDRD